MLLDHLLDLAFHSVQVEASWLLHRWIFDGRLCRFGDHFLNHHEAPELACIEVISVAKGARVGGLPTKRRGALKRVLSNVNNRWHVSRDFLSRPAVRLLEKLKLEVIESNCAQLGATEIKEFVAT